MKEKLNEVSLNVHISDQGYTNEYYQVVIGCPKHQVDIAHRVLKELDHKYGGDGRFSSTSIKQLQEGAIKEGYSFVYTKIDEPSNIDYSATSGNY